MENEKKRGLTLGSISGFIVPTALALVCAWLFLNYGISPTDDASFGKRFLLVFVSLVVLIISVVMHIIIHEAGHLVFGLASGYKLSSFRIFSFMWLKEDGKTVLKRLSVAGTAGQCLMTPPDMRDGKIPVVLFNLGGSLLNIISASVFLAAWFIIPHVMILRDAVFIFAVCGYLLGLLNAIPIHTAVIDNDGYNALMLSRTSSAMRAFWIQMKINDSVACGARLKDMPDEWFAMPSDRDMKNSMVAAIGVFCCNRLLDEGKFTAADSAMKHILSIESGMVGLHRALLISDRMFIELIGRCRHTVIDEMLTDEQKRIVAQMSGYPGVIRTKYAYALLYEKDAQKAEQLLERFNDVAGSYPYKSDVESERELIAAAMRVSATAEENI